MNLTEKESWIALTIIAIISIAAVFFFISEANKCAAKDGRYIIGGKYDYPACVKEVK